MCASSGLGAAHVRCPARGRGHRVRVQLLQKRRCACGSGSNRSGICLFFSFSRAPRRPVVFLVLEEQKGPVSQGDLIDGPPRFSSVDDEGE